ncbi:MAG TPA: hypothetical protein VEC37_14800 [Bacillota bacterium]|nr:hypothetical protein [Bacillota bacterium]
MKKLSVLVLVSLLMLTVATGAFAAVHNSWGDFVNYSTDRDMGIATYGGWYYIEPESPYFIGNLKSTSKATDIGALYYLNDFTFAEVATIDDGEDAVIRGSYKFDNGLIAGLDAGTKNDDYAMFSLGYFYALGKNGFVAFSGDYDTSDTGDGLLGVDVDFRYYTDKMRVFGQVYNADKNAALAGGEDQTFIDLAVNYKLQENLVVGAGLSINDDTSVFSFGGTYSEGELVADGAFSYDTDLEESTLALMGMYNFTEELTAGLYGEFTDDEDYLALKAIYALDKESQVRLSYRLNEDNELQLAYYKAL